MAPANGKITLAILATKLDNVIELLHEHRRQFAEHVAKDDAMYVTVDRLDIAEKNRNWQLRALWTAVASGLVAFIINLFRTQ